MPSLPDNQGRFGEFGGRFVPLMGGRRRELMVIVWGETRFLLKRCPKLIW